MELNNDWVNINLGKSALLKARIGWQGLTTSEYLNSGDYFLVTGTDFLNGYIDWKNCVYVEKERYDQDKYIQLQVDDILVTKDGTIGKVAIIDKIIKPTTLNSGVFVVRPIKNSFYPKYLFYILRSGHFSDFLSKLTAGSTINHLYQKDFVYYTFPAPPTIEEQKQIANTLSDTDQLIQNLKTLIAKKKAIKQGAMQELLTGKKRLQGFTEEWETKKLGEISSMKSGGTPLTSFKEYYGGDIPWMVIADITASGKYISKTEKNITKFGLENSSANFFPKDTLFLAMYASIGKCTISKIPMSCNQAILGITTNKIDTEFLFYFLSSIGEKLASSGQTGTQSNLNKEMVMELDIPYPSSQEQQAIAQILSDMDAEIEALEQQLQKIQTLKQGMMQELLTGKIRLVKPKVYREQETIHNIAAEPTTTYKK